MPTRKCLGTNKTTFQSILGVSISVRKYCQKILNGGDPPLLRTRSPREYSIFSGVLTKAVSSYKPETWEEGASGILNLNNRKTHNIGALYFLWQCVQNYNFAKSRDKPHTNVNVQQSFSPTFWPPKKLLGILSNMVPKSSKEGSLFLCAHFCP